MNHMKYIIDSQWVRMTGEVSSDVSETHAGIYDEQVHIGEDGDIVSIYEHTDGVNFYDFELGTTRTAWASDDVAHALTLSASASLGFLFPRTEVRALGLGSNQPYKVSGFGLSGSALIRYHYQDLFFVDFGLKGGWLDFVSAASFESVGHSSHSYGFLESILTVGTSFQL